MYSILGFWTQFDLDFITYAQEHNVSNIEKQLNQHENQSHQSQILARTIYMKILR